MYYSFHDPIFQSNPTASKPTFKRNGAWVKKYSFTETAETYVNAANKVCSCLDLNRKLGANYCFAASINIELELEPASVRKKWAAIVRKLESAGLVALWVREPSKSNHVNYHLIVASKSEDYRLEQANLERIISRSIPDGIPFHKWVKPIASQSNWARYIFKAKGYGEKRILFRAGIGLNKLGTIGPFWVKPMKTLWAMIRAREEQISSDLENPAIRCLVLPQDLRRIRAIRQAKLD